MIICLYALAIAISSWATGQQGDVIFIDGEKWTLLGEPIQADSALAHRLLEILPKDRELCSSNWKGYTAYWSIKDECLYLDSILVSTGTRVLCLSDSDMHKVFHDYYCKTSGEGYNDEGIIARWLTCNIRAGKGRKIYYEHAGYLRDLEYEQIITINEGRVMGKKAYHNCVAIEGFSFNQFHKNEEFKEKIDFPFEDYPELAGKKVMFYVTKIQIDTLGNLIDCYVSTDGKDEVLNKRLVQDMKTALMNIRPWKVLFIREEYLPDVKNRRFTLPF